MLITGVLYFVVLGLDSPVTKTKCLPTINSHSEYFYNFFAKPQQEAEPIIIQSGMTRRGHFLTCI